MKLKGVRSDSWSSEEDKQLVRVLMAMARQGHMMKDIFSEISRKLNRTEAAINFRWNAVLSDKYKDEFQRAKITGMKTRSVRAQKAREVSQRAMRGEFDNKPMGDTRYNVPKTAPNTDKAEVMAEIFTNPIYFDVLKLMLNLTPEQKEVIESQKEQVAYGLEKYPESLNDKSWTIVETISHAMGELADLQHYLAMLKIQLVKLIEGENK